MGSVAASLVSMKPSSTSITSEVGWRTSEVVRITSDDARLTPLSPRPSSSVTSQSKEVSRRPACRCVMVVVALF